MEKVCRHRQSTRNKEGLAFGCQEHVFFAPVAGRRWRGKQERLSVLEERR